MFDFRIFVEDPTVSRVINSSAYAVDPSASGFKVFVVGEHRPVLVYEEHSKNVSKRTGKLGLRRHPWAVRVGEFAVTGVEAEVIVETILEAMSHGVHTLEAWKQTTQGELV